MWPFRDYHRKLQISQETKRLTALFRAHAIGPADCAHLCVDVQEIYTEGYERTARKIGFSVANDFRRVAIENYWIHYSFTSDSNNMPTGIYKFSQFMPPEHEPVIAKDHISTFRGSKIDELLKQAKTRLVAITGFVHDCCVKATALDACEKGYLTVIFSDCTDYRGRTVTVEELANAGVIHARSESFFAALRNVSAANQNSSPALRHGT